MPNISYQEIFWLFMLGNILGVILEGLWCLFRYGKWETHVVALWGPFNIVYGIGIAVFYIGNTLFGSQSRLVRVILLALLGSFAEYLCGLVIRIGIHMRAWDYSNHFLNLQGLISPKMTLMWGFLGFGFDRFLYIPLRKLVATMAGGLWEIACMILSAFMIINLSFTAVCIIRWANRHRGKPPKNKMTQWIDGRYPDIRMKKKFCDWQFIEDTVGAISNASVAEVPAR